MTATPNPYIAGNPLTGSEMFFGRADVFYFIDQALSGQHQDNVLVLYGQRRTGKTSVLYQMDRHLSDRYLCIFIDLHGLALDGLNGFIQELANYIYRGLRKNYQINLPEIDHEAMAADPRFYFESTILDNIWEAAGDRHLLLMLDEAVRLEEQIRAGKMDAEVFNYLRHLMQHHPRLDFLLSLGSGLEEMEKEYAFLFNVALYKKISFLDRQSAVELITTPVAGIYRVEPNALERILEVASGHPYHTQLICHGLYNYAQSRGLSVVSRTDVDAILDEAVERGLAVLKHVWEESSEAEKAVQAGMAAAIQEGSAPDTEEYIRQLLMVQGINIPRTLIAGAIKSLIARDVIAGEDTYRFTVDLQRRWVQKYRRIEWVKGEIEPWLKTLPPEPEGSIEEMKTTLLRDPRRKITWISTGVLILAVGVAVLALAYLAGRGGFYNRQVTAELTAQGSGVVLGGAWGVVNDFKVIGDEVWAATDGGLVRWLADGQMIIYNTSDIAYPGECVNTMEATKDNEYVFFGCGGVTEMRPSGDQIEYLDYFDRGSGLGMGVIRGLFADGDGGIWAGGKADPEGLPLSYFDGENWGASHPAVDALSEFRETLPSIRTIASDSDGRLWLGSDDISIGGVFMWDGEAYHQYTYSNPEVDDPQRVRSILVDSHGNVWVAAGSGGLLNLILDDGTYVPFSLPDYEGEVNVIVELPDGSLWTGGESYVATSTDFGKTWTQVGTSDGLGEYILSIIQIPDGRIVAASYGGGISILQDGTWVPVPLTQ